MNAQADRPPDDPDGGVRGDNGDPEPGHEEVEDEELHNGRRQEREREPELDAAPMVRPRAVGAPTAGPEKTRVGREHRELGPEKTALDRRRDEIEQRVPPLAVEPKDEKDGDEDEPDLEGDEREAPLDPEEVKDGDAERDGDE